MNFYEKYIKGTELELPKDIFLSIVQVYASKKVKKDFKLEK